MNAHVWNRMHYTELIALVVHRIQLVSISASTTLLPTLVITLTSERTVYYI
jgi:hypothetical protein